MKIKINREIDVPDSFRCVKCYALEPRYANGKLQEDAQNCCNFNDVVFWRDGYGYVKCRACIDATLDYLHRVTK